MTGACVSLSVCAFVQVYACVGMSICAQVCLRLDVCVCVRIRM